MKGLKKLILITFLTISVGCTQQPKKEYVFVPVPIQRPTRPEFPKVKGSELSCVSNETKQQLLMRDDVIKSYMTRLEAIIDETSTKQIDLKNSPSTKN